MGLEMRLILARDYVSHTLPAENRHCRISSLTLKIKFTVASISAIRHHGEEFRGHL